MKFALSWLKDHLETTADAAAIAEKLTSLGLEIEGVEDASAALSAFRVARVLTAEKHPQADKLQVLSVDVGSGEPLQVVCGAPNARAGMIGVLGLPGAVVPANGMELRKSAIRGVESNGMMCSTRELGLGDEHDGIIELPADATVGQSFADYAGSDPVFDVAITPNRPDCMGVYGIARDLAAAGLGALKPVAHAQHEGTFACPTEIRIDDPEGCPAFFGRVIRGVSNGASPEWMQARLKSAGQRPISALVDITNYVMLGFGRPAHAYDLAQLSGAVVARRAKDGEGVTTLNGKHYLLDHSMTVIADDNGVHDVAGIMGGQHSGCSETTRDVLLEVAYFAPQNIARTGQALALTSDARTRFERGVDPAFLDTGLDLLTALILDICGGEPSHVIRAGAPPAAAKVVGFDLGQTLRLGGIDVPLPEQRRILEALGFSIVAQAESTGERWAVSVHLARRCRRRARPGRRSGARPWARCGAVHTAHACRRRGQAHRHPGPAARTPRAPRGGGARAERGGHLVVPAAGRGRCLCRWKRRAVEPYQSDQRRHESHAPLAAAGLADGDAAQSRARARFIAAFRDRPAVLAWRGRP